MRTIRASRRTSAIGKKRIVIASAKLERSAVARSSSDQIAIGSAVRSSRAAAAARQAAWVPAAIVRGYERSAWRARRLPRRPARAVQGPSRDRPRDGGGARASARLVPGNDHGVATRHAQAAGVADRVHFEVHDVMAGIPPTSDLVTAFDSLHDMADPVEGLRAAARGLQKDGTLLVLELGSSDDLADEAGPIGVIHHATKLFYNLPIALAAFGSARGNMTFSDKTMRMLCRKAGLRFVRALPVRNPLHKLYV